MLKISRENSDYTENGLSMGQIETLKSRGWSDRDFLQLADNSLYKLRAMLDLIPGKNMTRFGAITLFGGILATFGLGMAFQEVDAMVESDGWRTCGSTENPLTAGNHEFTQIAKVTFNLDPSTGNYVSSNVVEPGMEGYVYPGADGRINPGDNVAGFYSTCASTAGAGVELYFYHPIGQ